MRRALKILAGLIVAVIIAIVAVFLLVPTEKIAQIAADQVKSATGRELTLAGGVSPSFYPVIGVETGAVALSNADWADAPTMVSASSAKVGVELIPLLSGEIKVSEIRLIDPVIALEVNGDGTPNWEFAGSGQPSSTSGAGEDGFVKSVSLGEAVIENGSVSFVDRTTGQAISVDAINAVIGLDALDSPLSVEGDAVWNGEKTDIALMLSTPAAAMAGEAIEFDIALSSNQAEVTLKGSATPPSATAQPVLNADFSAKAAAPAAAILWATGAPAPDGLKELTNLDVTGKAEMNDQGAAIDVTGGVTRGGEAAKLALKAAGAPDWASRQAFDVDLAAEVGSLARLSYIGAVAQGRSGPSLNGRYSVASSNPAKAAAWATGGAPEGLNGLTDLALDGVIEMGDSGLSASAKGGVKRDGTQAKLDLKAASGADWATKRAFNVALDAALADLATLTFNGAAAAPDGGAPSLNGKLSLDAPNLKGLAAFAGAALPAGAPGTFRALKLDGDVRTTGPNGVELGISSLRFDDIQANGAVAINFGGPLTINANLESGALDLRPYMTTGESAPSGGPGWSKEKIDLSGLAGINGDFKIRAKSVALPPKMQLGRSDITAKLRNGKLDLKIRELGLYGGGLVGDVVVDGQNGNAIRANVSASAVKLLPMLKALADIGMIEGLGRAEISVAGGGQSLHAIMNSLDGKGSMLLTDGAIVGYDIAGMVRNIQTAFSGGGGGKAKKTDFSEVSGTFDIQNGLLTNADFKFLGPLLRIVGNGTVDLGGQSVNFRLTPKAVASLKGQGGSIADKGLAFPLIVTGPWHNVSIRPDLEAGIGELLKDPEGALKALEDLGAGGAAGALEGVTGQGGDAVKAIEELKEDPAKALESLIGGGERVTQRDIRQARQDLQAAKETGNKKAIRQARKRLKDLQAQKEAQDNNPIGGIVDGLLKKN